MGLRTLTARHLAAAVCAVAVLPAAAAAQVRPTTFATLNGPIGVAVGADQSVFVTYDGVGDVRLLKLDPQGAPVAQTAFGDFSSVGQVGKLAIDPATGAVWDLLTTGNLLVFDPVTLAGRALGSLRSIPIDRSSVFDVSQGRARDMSGEILPELSTFGDVALLRRGGVLDVFATGRSSSGVPYVVRVRFAGDAFTGGRAVAAASISSREDNVARGVAVNGAGVVLTTLPTPDPRLNVQDRPYVFGADFPVAGAPPRLALGGRDLSSRGMATDAAGNFFVTGSIGSTLCGRDAAGAIVVLAPQGQAGLCHPLSPTPLNAQDVAVGPAGAPTVYSTLLAYPGQVLRWGALPLPPAGGGAGGDVVAPDPRRALRAEVSAAVARLRRLGLRRLRRSGGFTVTGFDATGPATLRVRVRRGRTLVASRTRRFQRAGTYRVRVALTRAGRRQLRSARRARLRVTFRLTAGGRTIEASRTTLVRR